MFRFPPPSPPSSSSSSFSVYLIYLVLLLQSSFRPRDYMGSQIEINAKMRAILVDWLIEVHYKFELMPETLYLTVYIIDRYLSLESVLRRDLQLVGITAMLIACKYEEIWAPEVFKSLFFPSIRGIIG